MKRARLSNWPERLAAAITNQRVCLPKWGTNDCMLWAASGVEAVTGIDDLAEVRGKYSTAKGALKICRKSFGVSVPVELMDLLWGPRLHISQARMGDVVVVRLPEHEGEFMSLAAGICYGRRSFFVGTDTEHSGLVARDTINLEHCYSI